MGSLSLFALSALLVSSLITMDAARASPPARTAIGETIMTARQPSTIQRRDGQMDQQTSALQDHRKAVYSVVLRNETPKLNAGETVLVIYIW